MHLRTDVQLVHDHGVEGSLEVPGLRPDEDSVRRLVLDPVGATVHHARSQRIFMLVYTSTDTDAESIEVARVGRAPANEREVICVGPGEVDARRRTADHP